MLQDHPEAIPRPSRRIAGWVSGLAKESRRGFSLRLTPFFAILPFLFVFPALYINKEKIIHIILRRKDLPMVAGSDRSYLRAFRLSHNPVFPLRVPRFSSPTHHFPTPSTCFSSLASLFFFFFTPYSPQIGPHRKRIATSRFSSVFPPFSL